jgi:hypothetical protein
MPLEAPRWMRWPTVTVLEASWVRWIWIPDLMQRYD